ncbi:MAG: lipopolysaccharide heptosyltransferase II, partial [Planctomycetota bacterium]
MSENAKKIDSLVIRLPNWVGDAVMATPALRSMRKGFRESRICLIGKPGILNLLKGLPYYDTTLEFRGRGFRPVLSLAAQLRKNRFDMGLLLPNSFSSALAFFLGGVRERVGYGLNGRNRLLHLAPLPEMDGLKRKPSPMTDYYLDLALLSGGEPTSRKMELRTEPELDAEAGRLLEMWGLGQTACRVGLNPGASFGPSKLWTPEGFARLSDQIHEELNGRTLLLCGPNETEIADAITARANHPIVDTSRKVLPLDLLKSMIARMSAVVSTDTGPRHLAAALNVPVVVIMGPTDPRYTETNLERTTVIRKEVPCGPCHKKVCDLDHSCMTKIKSVEVFEALVKG